MHYLDQGAVISADGVYRYSLFRRVGFGSRTILFVGLNPSTADGEQDDPTIRRCAGFALKWGFDVLLMGNVYALRSTNPRRLAEVEDPVGTGNQEAVRSMAKRSEVVVVAWGAHEIVGGAKRIAESLLQLDRTMCLGQTKSGAPKHPLYLPAGTELRRVRL